MPSKELLEATWGRGELASHIPFIDLDLHDAIVQERNRPMTTADVSKGIDLRKLAIDTSKISIPDGPELQPEEIEAFVDDFFNALDKVNEYDEDGISEHASISNDLDDDDGSSVRPSDEELAALDAQVSNEIELVEPSNEDLAAMMDDFYPADDEMMDEAEMLAAMATEEPPEYPDWINEPILDLSVLEKPVVSKEGRDLN
jgi:type IV secretion system protein VirD4